MTISSNRIVVALLVTAMFCCTAVDAATFKIATVTPEGSQWMTDMRAGATEIKKRTEGRVQIKYFGGGIMGNDKKVLGQIRIGRLQGGALTPSALGSRYPDINLYGMPLVFDSEEEAAYVRKRLDERLGAGLEDAGFVTFGFAAGGFANILSNTPVRGLADLKGKRVWVLEGDTITAYVGLRKGRVTVAKRAREVSLSSARRTRLLRLKNKILAKATVHDAEFIVERIVITPNGGPLRCGFSVEGRSEIAGGGMTATQVKQ